MMMLRPAEHWTDIVINWIMMIMIILPLVSVSMVCLIAVMMWIFGAMTS